MSEGQTQEEINAGLKAYLAENSGRVDPTAFSDDATGSFMVWELLGTCFLFCSASWTFLLLKAMRMKRASRQAYNWSDIEHLPAMRESFAVINSSQD